MVLHLKNNTYIDVDSYGANSWGTLQQHHLTKEGNSWFSVCCFCTDSELDLWEEDRVKLDVIEELEKLPKNAELDNKDDYDYFKYMCKILYH